MKILKKATSFLIAISIILTNSSYIFALEESKPEESVKIPSRSIYTHEKIIGRDRYETGRMTLEESKRFDNIIVVNGIEEKLVDGLCASSLVEKLNASILPINPNRVDKKSMEYINKAKNVYIIGENQAIPYSFEESIDKKVNVTRIGGKDRFETSEKIAKYLGNYDKAYIVNGIKGEADAMSISSVAARDKNPVILTKKSSAEIDKKDGVEYTVIGGNEVVSDEVLSNYSAIRIGGETRYETNREVLEKFYPGRKVRYFTNGETLVDALSAASLSKNDGITFINRRKNHDLLKCIDTVQVGGFPYEIIFTNEGCGGSGGNGGGTVTPPSKPDKPTNPDKPVDPNKPVDPDKPTDPDKPVDPDKPTDPQNHKPTTPKAEATVIYVGNGEGFVNIKITEKSTDADGDEIKYKYKYNDKIVEKEINDSDYDDYYPLGNHTVQVKAVEVGKDNNLESEWYDVDFLVNEVELKDATLCRGDTFNNIIKGMEGYENVNTVEFIKKEDDSEYPKNYKNLDLLDKGIIKGYIENNTLYISSKEEIYANPSCRNLLAGDRRHYSNIKYVKFKNFNTSQVIDMSNMFIYCQWLGELDLSKFDTSQVTDMSHMFQSCNQLTRLDLSKFNTSQVTDMSYMFNFCSGLTTIDLSKFNTSQVTDMSHMFESCNQLTRLDLSKFSTSQVTDMSWMFDCCEALTELNLSNFDTSKVTNMEAMIRRCKGLTTIDLSNFNTSQVTDMSHMFQSCNQLTTIDLSKFDTSKVTDMGHMFLSCSGLTTINLSKINTSQVTDMSEMFEDCSGLTTIDLSSFNTSQVKNMSEMFKDCSGLTTIDLSKFNTSQVKNMSYMFMFCRGLTTIDLSSFNTSQVKNMIGMFMFCDKLTTIDLSKFNTSQVINMGKMFNNCSRLTTIDLSSFDTSRVISMCRMFDGCDGLTTLNLRSFNTSQVKNMNGMFCDCEKLTTLDLKNFDTLNLEDGKPPGFTDGFEGCISEMFKNCRNLTGEITIKSNKFELGRYNKSVFEKCSIDSGKDGKFVVNYTSENKDKIQELLRGLDVSNKVQLGKEV